MPGGRNLGAYRDLQEHRAGAVGGDEARAGHWPVSKVAIHNFNTQSSCSKAVWSHRLWMREEALRVVTACRVEAEKTVISAETVFKLFDGGRDNANAIFG